MVDVDEEKGALSLNELSKQFGSKRAIFLQSDVTNRSELEGIGFDPTFLSLKIE